MKPQRIKLSRARGFRLQDVSRAINGLPARAVTRPGIYGNPFRVGRDGTAEECVARFRADVEKLLAGEDGIHKAVAVTSLRRIKGMNLACHCKLDEPCHADVLLELANKEPES